MNRFSVQHVIHCDEDIFWKLFFSRPFNARMYSEVFKFPEFEIIEEHEDERAIVRKATGQPRVNAMPEAVQKMLGSNFRYVEESVFDKTAKTWRWTMTPNRLHDRLRNEGVLRLEPDGPARVIRRVDVTVEAKIFGVGKVLEGLAEKELRAGWDRSAVFLNAWLSEHPAGTRAMMLEKMDRKAAQGAGANERVGAVGA
jgi:hypothetical protein